MPSVLRSRRSERKYTNHRRQLAPGICEFCEFAIVRTQVIKECQYFWVIATKFVYDMWDSHGVDDHRMLVPKRHISSFGKFTDKEQREFFKLAAAYEKQQYTMYTRPPGSKTKTVSHHHTHLIKLSKRPKRIILFLRRPHTLFMR